MDSMEEGNSIRATADQCQAGLIDNQVTATDDNQNIEVVDDFECYLDENQLPFYRDMRKKSLSGTKMTARIAYLSKCQEEVLTPADSVLSKPTSMI